LIRKDEKREAADRLAALLLEGLEGKAKALIRKDWNDIREEALAQVTVRRKSPR